MPSTPPPEGAPPALALCAALILDPQLEARSGHALLLDASGRVHSLRPTAQLPPGLPREELGAVALAPGLVSAHSHAFQRLLRGRTHQLDARRPQADFWTWREAMYGQALRLSPEQVEAVSAQAFLELALAGHTSVGEFHYLHHDPEGRPYADANELAHRVIRAARRVGLRIHLLRVLYHRAGAGRPALPEQRRFVDPTVDLALQRAEALAQSWAGHPQVSVGIAPHSVRAVPFEWLRAAAQWAAPRDAAVHVHACEQRRELAECRAEHGCEPIELIDRAGLLGPRTTIVHAIHLEDTALDRLADRGATVCACPSTERDLGDGVVPAHALLGRGVPIALGADSHAHADSFAELRQIEGHLRLQRERRNVLAPYAPVDARGQQATARALWPMATTAGHRSLAPAGGAPTSVGTFEPGAPADLFSLDLRDPTLLGTDAESLLSALCFSAHPGAVRDVWVAGQRIVRAGQHAEQAAITEGYLRTVRALQSV